MYSDTGKKPTPLKSGKPCQQLRDSKHSHAIRYNRILKVAMHDFYMVHSAFVSIVGSQDLIRNKFNQFRLCEAKALHNINV